MCWSHYAFRDSELTESLARDVSANRPAHTHKKAKLHTASTHTHTHIQAANEADEE